MMFKKILVPLDGSTNSEKVLGWITGLAGKLEAELVLLGIPGPAAPSSVSNEGDAGTQHAVDYLERQARGLREQGFAAMTLVEYGHPAQMIIAVADRVAADMIAMATHRDRLIERGILGSVTDAVLRTAFIPVLAINPDGDHFFAPTSGVPSTVIVPLDGSELAEESVPVALDIALACGAEVIFVQAVHLPAFAVSGPGVEFYDIDLGVSGERERARKYVAKFVEQAKAKGIPAKAHAALGNAAGRILEDTRNIPDALIVISSHGRGGFKRMMLGSVADKLVRASHHPVLVLKHANNR